jgi:hypothetical protein
VNLYRYVGNKTPLLIDPSGLQPKDKHFGLPNDFWKWNHRQEGKDDLEDIDRETAEERCEEWEAAGRPNAEGTRTTPEKGDGESNKERPTTPPMPPSRPYNPPYTPPEPPTAPPISPGAAVGIGTVIGLGLLTAAAVISPFDGPALDFAAGSAFVGALATY